jgi:hypothetical protein
LARTPCSASKFRNSGARRNPLPTPSQSYKPEFCSGPTTTLRYLSNSWLDVATAIHYYQAILATLAIVIWHFYAVIFDPEVYPLKWTLINGRAPEHGVREEEEAAPQAAASKAATGNPPSPTPHSREPDTPLPRTPQA